MGEWFDWVESEDSDEPNEDEVDGECPDLLSFYSEMSAMRHTLSRGLRKTHEEVVGLSQRVPVQSEGVSGPVSEKDFIPGLAGMFTRMNRLLDRMQTPPRGGIFVKNWRHEWDAVRDALDIIRSHFQSILTELGIEEIDARGRLFDPSSMMAVSSVDSNEADDGMVLEVVTPGYRRGDTILKFAEVTVARNGKDAR